MNRQISMTGKRLANDKGIIEADSGKHLNIYDILQKVIIDEKKNRGLYDWDYRYRWSSKRRIC